LLSNQMSGPDLKKGDSQILEGRVLSRILGLRRTIQKVMVGMGPVGIACNLLVVGLWAYLPETFPISSHLRVVLSQRPYRQFSLCSCSFGCYFVNVCFEIKSLFCFVDFMCPTPCVYLMHVFFHWLC